MKTDVGADELYDWGACGEVEEVLDNWPDRRIPLTHEAVDELEELGHDPVYWMGHLARPEAVWARYSTIARHELAAELPRHPADSDQARRIAGLHGYLKPPWRTAANDSARALTIRLSEIWGDYRLATHWMFDILLRALAEGGGDGDR